MAIDIEILSCNTNGVEIDSCCAAVISGGSFSPGDFVLRPELYAVSGALQTEINNIVIGAEGVTGISITGGQSIIGGVNFTGIGGLKVTQQGQNVIFSGGAASSSGPSAGLTWNLLTGNYTGLSNNGYIVSGANLVNLTLPISFNFGDEFRIVGKSPSGWQISQNPGNKIVFGVTHSTPGTGGYIASTYKNDCVGLVCTESGVEMTVSSSIGNIQLV